MKNKMETLLRYRLEDIADEVRFIVDGYDSKWKQKHVLPAMTESAKRENRIKCKERIEDRFNEFETALNIFDEADMLTYEERKAWYNAGRLMLREGRQAIEHYYEGRDWYKEELDENCQLRKR